MTLDNFAHAHAHQFASPMARRGDGARIGAAVTSHFFLASVLILQCLQPQQHHSLQPQDLIQLSWKPLNEEMPSFSWTLRWEAMLLWGALNWNCFKKIVPRRVRIFDNFVLENIKRIISQWDISTVPFIES